MIVRRPLLRRLSARALEGFGYHVLQAEDANQAFVLAGAHEGPIHLLLCDVVLPGAGGPELAIRLQSLFPGLPALYISGYERAVLAERASLPSDADLLAKPFRPSELIARVSAALTHARARQEPSESQ